MALSKKLNAKLIFNVSDLWPESAEKMGIVTNKLLLKMAYRLETHCYLKPHFISGQTQGIVDDIKGRHPSKDVFWLPNGVDINFYNPDIIEASNFRLENGFSENDLIFFYGGILGYAQGLEVILHAANLVQQEKKIQLNNQGFLPESDKLVKLNDELKLQNIHFLNPVPKNEMPAVLKSIDVALVPLKKLEIFQGAIPSKVFEALAMKKPLLLGVDGEARHHFIEKGQAGMYFEPENEQELAKCVLFLSANRLELSRMSENARKYVSENFNRKEIARAFHNKLIERI